jgi:membrane-associated phospholipid phosphatase
MTWLIPAVLLVLAVAAAIKTHGHRGKRPYRDTGRHYRRNYSRRGFLKMGAAATVAAVIAHSGVDAAVESWHATEVKSPRSDRLAEFFKQFGERYWFLVWALFAACDGLLGSHAITRWGRRNSEAMVVGLPSLWTLQRVLGAGRPTDHLQSPHYHPFADDNTASGHTFIAAIPWLTLARNTGGPLQRWAARLAGVATGWSRINDRRHYLSQVMLGYYLAWQAVDSVHEKGADVNADPES